jgi:8-amino-7-oxononanoate synthase
MSLHFLNKYLKEYKRKKLYRKFYTIEERKGTIVKIGNKEFISFSSNDYLGLSCDKRIIDSFQKSMKYGFGSSGSRLICGNFEIHNEVEKKFSKWMEKEASLIFPTGYMTNVGVISSLVSKDDIIFSDELNHASIIDGCRLSKAKIIVYPHCDIDALYKLIKNYKNKRKFIITETIFSMDGDMPPLIQIVEIAKKYNAITIIDEAHAFGVFGKEGKGVANTLGIANEIDVIIATLGKAFGCFGGIVFGSKELIEFLKNKSRSFIYTTSLPPSFLAAISTSLDIVKNGNDLRKKLWENVSYLRDKLKMINKYTSDSCSQIIPITYGSINKLLNASRVLFNYRIFAVPIRPPTVPKGKEKIRISVSSLHTKAQIDKLIHAIKKT